MHAEDYFGLESVEADVVEANREFVDTENELWREGVGWHHGEKVGVMTPWAMGVEDGM